MNNKITSIPAGMIFKKHYCHNCGNKLTKEQTHRLVTPKDIDYYSFHDYNKFPRRNYDVYEHIFCCPNCEKRTSYQEQCIIERIQKKYKTKTLSETQIKENYEKSKKLDNNKIITRQIIFLCFINAAINFVLFFLFLKKFYYGIFFSLGLFALSTIFSIFLYLKSFKGKRKLRIKQDYSHEHKSLMHKLYTYSLNNYDLIAQSNKCYCFYCKTEFSSKDIKEFVDNNKTAICPNCKNKSILPDAIDDKITKEIIEDMKNFWY